MGIHNLMKLIEEYAPNAIKNATLKNYFNRIMAIDISMALYQFLVAIQNVGGLNLTNAEGEATRSAFHFK
jgi:flap endonuclease-1